MSRLLLVHERSTGGVDVLLADAEARENGKRVFRRDGRVVLRVGDDAVVVVRDARRPGGQSAGSRRNAPETVLCGHHRSVAAR